MNIFKTDNKPSIFILHLLAWFVIASVPMYLVHMYGNGDWGSLNHFYVNMLTYGGLFYSVYLWLVPHFYLKERKLLFFILTLTVIVFFYAWVVYLNDYLLFDPEKARQFDEAIKKYDELKQAFRKPVKEFRVFAHFLISILVSGFALGLRVLERLSQNEKARKELEKEKLNSELAFLKNQISPHFFFNTLNNIYSLIGIDPPQAQESVLKLSGLMRYLLYESENGRTLLSHEVDFMKHYIDLMKLRLTPRVDLEVNFSSSFVDREIPPLLFISFIENAFKHGISYRDNSFIHIDLWVDEDKIIFYCNNSMGRSSQTGDGQSGGIGLENVQKRLQLLFGDKHKLIIDQTAETFNVSLTIFCS
jgi:hypothetical protein